MFLTIVSDYMVWHYTTAWRDLFHVWFNLVWFVTHFFSIAELSRSLFAPWKRMTERRREWSFEAVGEAIVVNLMSRFIGFLMRTILILLGLVCLAALFVGIVVVFALWFVAPSLVIGGILTGIVTML